MPYKYISSKITMDKLTPEQRRKSMQANKSKGTKIELILGKAMFAKGLRYRKNNKKVFGTPDFTFKKYKMAIFADGDFWHGKDWETKKKKLGANAGYWFDKIERNLERDYKVNKKLKEDGWMVLRFWESDIRKNIHEISEFICQNFEERKAMFEQEKALRKKKSETEKELFLESYLKNKLKNASTKTKNKAARYTQEILQYKYPDDNVSLKVAEELLKYGIFNDEKKTSNKN